MRTVARVLCVSLWFVLSLSLFAGTPPEQLIAAAKKNGRVAVIIGVRDEQWRAEGTLPPAAVAKQRARGAQKKAELRRLHPGIAVVPERDYTSIPYFLAVVDEKTLRALIADDRVSSIEEDSELQPALAESVVRIGAKSAHTMQPVAYNGTGQIVVVLDTGVDPVHPFLASRLLQADAACFSQDIIAGAGDGSLVRPTVCRNGQTTEIGPNAADPCTVGDYQTNPSNSCHHGTKVAGVVAGVNGPSGMTGVAPGAEIVPIQIASKFSASSSSIIFLKSSMIKALDYTATTLWSKYGNRIAAVNISNTSTLSYPSREACEADYTAMKSAVTSVRAREIAVVAATGNNSRHEATAYLYAPACFSNVIAVSATTDEDPEKIPSYANTNSFMDLFAPGGGAAPAGITTSQNTACLSACEDYVDTTGTSLAAPHVAGAFAILRQRAPNATVSKLLTDLVRTGVPVNDPDIDSYGKRRINVKLALTRNRYDHDGDGRADVFWRNTANGQNFMYKMIGNAVTPLWVQGESDLNWKIAGIADFNGDGMADVLWRNDVNGTNFLYTMNGATVASGNTINVEGDLNWKIAAVGDFNGDNKADIFWRNSATGQNWIYFMNGPVITASVPTRNEGDLNWKVVASGDFNGDGKDDLYWRNFSNGYNYVYEMDGATVNGFLAQGEPDMNWKVAGAGDFNADGRDDILWRHDVNGMNFLYQMSAGGVSTGLLINTEGNMSWKVANVADYDGNGTADIYWRNASTGQNWMYLMNGHVIQASVPTQSESDLNWKIQR